jgi:hypothetical protein
VIDPSRQVGQKIVKNRKMTQNGINLSRSVTKEQNGTFEHFCAVLCELAQASLRTQGGFDTFGS